MKYMQHMVSKTTSDVAGSASNAAAAAGSKAGEYLDAAKRRTLPAPTLTQRIWSTITFKPLERVQVRGSVHDD